MSTPAEAYDALVNRSREIAYLNGANHLLGWDQETYMPEKALAFRAEQLAYLSGAAHRLFTSDETGAWISTCEDKQWAVESDEAANVREWRRHYDRAKKLPAPLVEDFERARTLARDAWVEARRKSNFPAFAPHLSRLLELNRQRAQLWGYKASPYDALIDEYEPYTTSAQLVTVFTELQAALEEILPSAVARSNEVPADLLSGDYPVERQQAFNRKVAEAVGFDFAAGRIDTTTHPFCSGVGAGDTRLTTRYDLRDFSVSLYGVLHEAGHGMYDQGLRAEAFGTPLGSAVSLGIHESQSRLWENHVGRSVGFWEYWHAAASEAFPNLRRLEPSQIAAALNRVAPSFIRVEADEVTYDLHIVLRFEIERRLVEGDLAVEDVPAFWNESFARLFGLQVPRDAEGCLQDIHWSLGSMGYFPTYTLGNLNAAQLFHRAGQDRPGLAEELRQGRYAALLEWLRTHIHRCGENIRRRN